MRKKLIILILTLFQLFIVKHVHSEEGEITWKFGIAIINGMPSYINPEKLNQSEMLISQKSVEQYKKEKKDLISHTWLIWSNEALMAYDSRIENPYGQINKSRTNYKYTVISNKMYLSKNDNEWSELTIKIVDDASKFGNSRNERPYFMIIYLKCKWFEGEYKVLGTSD